MGWVEDGLVAGSQRCWSSLLGQQQGGLHSGCGKGEDEMFLRRGPSGLCTINSVIALEEQVQELETTAPDSTLFSHVGHEARVGGY